MASTLELVMVRLMLTCVGIVRLKCISATNASIPATERTNAGKGKGKGGGKKGGKGGKNANPPIKGKGGKGKRKGGGKWSS